MRRKSRIDDGTEYYSLVRALRAVDDADVALLVIDATEGVTSQDQRLAERIDAAGCPVVVLLNKWDLLRRRRGARGRGHRASSPAAPLHRRGPGAEGVGQDRQGRAQAAAGAGRRHRALPPPGADARRQPGDRRGPAGPAGAGAACASCTACRARPTRRRSRCSPTATCRPSTFATSSASSARRSTSGPCRSSSASAPLGCSG